MPEHGPHRTSARNTAFAGLATLIAVMVAVLIPQTALLFWLGGIAERRNKAAPPQADSCVATKYPKNKTPDEIGTRARFRPLVILDATHSEESERRTAVQLLYRTLLHKIAQFVDVEEGGDGSDASMVSTRELADSMTGSATPSDEILVVFRSLDNTWVGFRCGDDSFRFRHRIVTKIASTVTYPARGDGGCGFLIYFNVLRKNLPPDLDIRRKDCYMIASIGRGDMTFFSGQNHVSALTMAFTEIARMLKAKREYSEGVLDV